MAKCKNCTYIKKRKATDENGYYPWCEIKADSPDVEKERDCKYFEKMTNADRVRKMTDEELLKFIYYSVEDLLDYSKIELMEWLQREVEDK